MTGFYDDTPESGRLRARSPAQRIRNSRAYITIRNQFKAYCATTRNPDGSVGLPCWVCHGEPIQYHARYHGPLSFELDHDLPVSERPDLILSWANFRPSHQRCNKRAGARTAEDVSALLGEPSERW